MNGTYNPHAGVDSPCNVLLSAQRYLIEYGWTRHLLFDRSTHQMFPPASVFGAICIALTGTPNLTSDQFTLDAATAMVAAVKQFATYLSDDGYGERRDFDFFTALDYIADWSGEAELTRDEVASELYDAAADYDWNHRVRVIL